MLSIPFQSLRSNCLKIATVAFAVTAAPFLAMAQTPDHQTDNSAYPTARDLKAMTTAGSYLAARHASVERDASAAAAFYRSALRTDPKNNELLDRAKQQYEELRRATEDFAISNERFDEY